MSKSNFKSIKKEIIKSKSNSGDTWQIQSDKHSSIISVTYDENAGPNKIAGLTYVNEPKNHYCFTLNARIKNEEFSAVAQNIVAGGLLPTLLIDSMVRTNRKLVVYPAKGQESHVAWLMQAFQQGAEICDVIVEKADVQIAEKKTVQGISIYSKPDVVIERNPKQKGDFSPN